MTYPAGAYFLTTVTGSTGWAIRVGQWLAGSPSKYQHAGIVIDADGTTVEAEPGGARYGHLSDYAGRPLLVCDGPVQTYLNSKSWLDPSDRPFLEQSMRNGAAKEARALIGTPYSALDYLALALLHLHLPSRWVRRRVETSGHLICSALVDRAYMKAGISLYDDGRLVGDVMPADLDKWARDNGGVA